MADIFELLKRKAQEQYAQGQPYRDLFFKGDPSGVLNKLEAWKNLPMDERVAQATDIGMGFAGTMKGVGKTPFEMAHKIAQKNAALPIEKGGLGLPKNNTAMDRAKAMGYTTPSYHGTTKSFNEFDVSKRGSATDSGWYGDGEYSAPNPSSADAYTMSDWQQYKEGANIMPLLLKNAESIPNEFGSITEYVTRNPNQIRSVNAAFDPFRRNEADILAGLLAVPATQLLEDDKDKKKRKTK